MTAIRSFRRDDLGPVAALWNCCLTRDPMDEERYWHHFILDPNFDPDGAHAADQELAAGMQIAQYARAGNHVTILSLTPGEKGHPRLSAAVDALFFAGLRTIERARPAHYVPHVYFSENWEDMEGFEPDVYLDTSDVFTQYRDALFSFELWHGGTGWPYADYYSAMARMRACLGGGLRWQYAAAMARPAHARVERRDALP